jgi:hypothetical protein
VRRLRRFNESFAARALPPRLRAPFLHYYLSP